ncbi:hypothetical protein ACGFSI_33040 [Streptomyces virginiae]
MAVRGTGRRMPGEQRTGIWIGNQKTRRDKPDANQLRALAGLGVAWAAG